MTHKSRASEIGNVQITAEPPSMHAIFFRQRAVFRNRSTNEMKNVQAQRPSSVSQTDCFTPLGF